MKKEIEELEDNKTYIVDSEGIIHNDEYDFFKNLHKDYQGIKDDIEKWEQEMLEEAEQKTGKEIKEKYRKWKK